MGHFLPSWIRILYTDPDLDTLTWLNPDPIRIRIRNIGTNSELVIFHHRTKQNLHGIIFTSLPYIIKAFCTFPKRNWRFCVKKLEIFLRLGIKYRTVPKVRFRIAWNIADPTHYLIYLLTVLTVLTCLLVKSSPGRASQGTRIWLIQARFSL